MAPGHTRKQANKKGFATTGSGNVMDDAPLFAGLEGFVLSQSAEVGSEIPSSEKPGIMTARTARRKIQAKTAEPQHDRAPKKPRETAPDSGAVLLTVSEMCRLLNISRATLVRLDNAGKVPGRIKLGGSVRFHRATVENWLQSLISSSPPPTT